MLATYNPSLVALSIAVAILVSYAALSLAARVAAADPSHVRIWVAGGAIAMGTGIWSMHFIGMMAVSLPIALRYDIANTLVSLAVAIVTSGCALWIAGGLHLGWRRLAAGSLLMGTGICAMHYSGMSAIQILPMIVYDPVLVAASVIIAVAASFAALWLAFHLRNGRSWQMVIGRLAAALVMGAAISGMHYTGMAASRFSRDAFCIGGVPIDSQWLGMVVGLITVALLAIALITAAFDAHLQSRTAAQAQRLKELNAELQLQAAKAQASEERLRQISDSIPAMIAYWDRDGICRFANKAHFDRFGLTPEQLVGMSIDEVIAFRRAGSKRTDENLRARIAAALAASASCSIRAASARTAACGTGRRILAEPQRRRGAGILCADRRYHAAQDRRKPPGDRPAAWAKSAAGNLTATHPGPVWSDMVYRIHDLPVGEMPSLESALDFYPPESRESGGRHRHGRLRARQAVRSSWCRS